MDVDARLCMLVSVSGCSSPSTLFVVSITCTNSFSASFHRPWFEYVNARLAMLLSVPGCSSPSTLFVVSTTCTCSFSASLYRPWFMYVNARLSMPLSVSGCSSPSTLFLVSITCTNSSPAASYRLSRYKAMAHFHARSSLFLLSSFWLCNRTYCECGSNRLHLLLLLWSSLGNTQSSYVVVRWIHC
jgi:hypothetical protein